MSAVALLRAPADWVSTQLVRPVSRPLVLVAKAAVIGFAVFNVIEAISKVTLGNDASAYWLAAERLRAGLPLYPAVTDPAGADVYHYAPWLAWLWVPLTYLPKQVVMVTWSGLLAVASGAILVALARIRAWVPLLLLGPIFVDTCLTGNIHPLLLAGLLFSLEGRWGPAWIGAAASLKGVPILLAGVYLGRREWRRLALAIAITAVLVAPTLFYDLSQYGTSAGGDSSRYGLPFWIAHALVVVLLVATPLIARTRYRWLVPAVAMMFALPFGHPYNLQLTFLGLAPFVHLGGRLTDGANG